MPYFTSFCGLALVYGCVESSLFFKVTRDNLEEASLSIQQQVYCGIGTACVVI